MSAKNLMLSKMLAISVNRNTLTLHVMVVDFCNKDIEIALFLEQLLYWTPRSSNRGWVSKSAKEWYGEIRITQYAIKKAMKLLHSGNGGKNPGKRPCISTKLKKFSGVPTTHYKIDMEKLTELWSTWLKETDQLDLTKREYEVDENDKSDKPEIDDPILDF
jgi:hypothetical protein